MTSKSKLRTQSTLHQIYNAQANSWASIGRVLDEVDRTDFWQSEASSFTQWLTKCGEILKLKEASMWRYLLSYRVGIQLHDELTASGVMCIDKEEFLNSTSPEFLEIYSKISRVAPKPILHELAVRMVNNAVTRSELRKVWTTYRPILDGQTARGKGVVAPAIDASDARLQDQQTNAAIVAKLDTSSAWIGDEASYSYRTFHDVRPLNTSGERPKIAIDVVALVKKQRYSLPEIHAIEVVKSIEDPKRLKLQFDDRRHLCHYLWFATSDTQANLANVNNVPGACGILIFSEQEISVYRLAQYLAPSSVEQMAFSLLDAAK
jgi:hypothetical protein